jgi:hypothetical protein
MFTCKVNMYPMLLQIIGMILSSMREKSIVEIGKLPNVKRVRHAKNTTVDAQTYIAYHIALFLGVSRMKWPNHFMREMLVLYSVSRQLEDYFSGLQGFFKGVLFAYPVSPNKNTLAFTPFNLVTDSLLARKEVN